MQKRTLLVLTVPILLMSRAEAREIDRETYLRYVPLSYPRLVKQLEATDELHLYGDRTSPAYRDVDPVDGIDDGRYEVLLALAVRFAPYLIQNTSNMPVNFDVYIDNRSTFPLNIDTWDKTGSESMLIRKDGINFSVLGRAVCADPLATEIGDEPRSPTQDAAIEDCKLLELLSRLSPLASQGSGEPLVRRRPDLFTVLFFDFPGEGAESWEQAYAPEFEHTPEERRKGFTHSYVHPFLTEAHDEEGALLGYELVLQYWFFYPSNDGGNNHEGDWEHLNVLIAPRSLVEQPLSAETVERILTGELPATDDTGDPLVIRRVDYYFHHFVMTLDFSSPNVYAPRSSWEAEVKRRPRTRFQENEIWRATRHMAYVDDAETIVNTHPFGYIGADNKGFDQALGAPGPRNRDGHGTFPFPGRYQNIGPAGATEQVSVFVDPRRYWRQVATGEVTTAPQFKRGSVIALADPDRLRIVPDWERVVDIVPRDAAARRAWSWLILPIRWGYPATDSPFAGILEHADTGNVAPVGPSFSLGWNATGSAPGFETYEPHTLPSVYPLGVVDSFRNDLGFLNLTVPVLFNLPPLDFLTRIASYPFKLAFERRDPVYYPKAGVPFRFFGLSSGVSTQVFDDEFTALALNPQQYDEFIAQLLFHFILSGADSTTTLVQGSEFQTRSVEPFFQIAFYIGDHFATENTVRNARSRFGFAFDFNNIPSYRYSAEVNYWEYAGSIRYSLSSSRYQPFLKGGYGWSWYRLENVQANDRLFTTENSDWIKPQHVWPNVWHYGVGFEFIPWKRIGRFPRGPDLALRFEYARYTQDLGLDLTGIPLENLDLIFDTLADLPGRDRVVRDDFVFGVTMTF